KIFTVFYHRTPRFQVVFVILLGSAMAVLWCGLVAAGQSNHVTVGTYSSSSVWRPVEEQAAWSAWQKCDRLDSRMSSYFLDILLPTACHALTAQVGASFRNLGRGDARGWRNNQVYL